MKDVFPREKGADVTFSPMMYRSTVDTGEVSRLFSANGALQGINERYREMLELLNSAKVTQLCADGPVCYWSSDNELLGLCMPYRIDADGIRSEMTTLLDTSVHAEKQAA